MPERGHKRGTNHEKQSHAQEQALSAEPLDYYFGEQTGESTAQDGTAPNNSENAFGFPGGQQVVGEGPDLSWGKNSEKPYPDVERGIKPDRMAVSGEPPKEHAIS